MVYIKYSRISFLWYNVGQGTREEQIKEWIGRSLNV